MSDFNSEHMIDISGLDYVEVFRALYAHAQPLGMGWLQFREGGMSRDEAEAIFAEALWERRRGEEDERRWLDYVGGRPMKLAFNRTRQRLERCDLYDRDQGRGAAARIVAALRVAAAAADRAAGGGGGE